MSGVTVEPASVTPPLATPDCTSRVSLTELRTVPVGRTSSAFSLTTVEAVEGWTIVLKRPASVAAIDTVTFPPRCSTVDPGMNRIESPSRAPAIRPDASTITAFAV